MPPKHKNPERTAVAPYNFVPLPEIVVALPENHPQNFLRVEQDHYQDDRLTGWIEVTLETKSPLYIRGSLTPEEYEQMEREENGEGKVNHLDKIRNKPEFFHTGDPNNPVIPGSSLRGMLRQAVEIVSHGKMQPVANTKPVYRAIQDRQYRAKMVRDDRNRSNLRNAGTPRVKGGYIRHLKGRWWIQPAEEVNDTTHGRISHKRLNSIRRKAKKWKGFGAAYEVFIQTSTYDYQRVRGGFVHIKKALVSSVSVKEEIGYRPAVILESGPMNKKASEGVIYAPDQEANPLPISEEMALDYLNQITSEQEDILGNKHGVLNDWHPVYYLTDPKDNIIFFGHTQMFRIPYRFSPYELLHPRHRDDKRIDFAEAIFGRRKGQESGEAGRIFISDANLANSQTDIWLSNQDLIPQILSSPKPTTYQHYLTQPNPNGEDSLLNYDAQPKDTTIRGYKNYWHKGDITAAEIEDKDVDKQKDKIHTRIKPVKAGVTFHFRVRFENLLPVELGAFMWALQPGGTNQSDGPYHHKLGMGKPLGLGAVHLMSNVHIFDMAQRYTALFTENGTWQEKEIENVSGTITDAIGRFESYILAVHKDRYDQFQNIPRIRMWLKMLSWPGPNRSKTRYMEIEHRANNKKGKENEYRGRPVLPDPNHV